MQVWFTPTLSMSFVQIRWRMSSSTACTMPARSKNPSMSSTTPGSVPGAAPKRISPGCENVSSPPMNTASIPCVMEITVRCQP